MPAAFHPEDRRIIEFRAGPVAIGGQPCIGTGHIDLGQRAGDDPDVLGQRLDTVPETLERFGLESECTIGRAGNPALQLGQLGCREAQGIRHCLAVNEVRIVHQRVGLPGRHFDEIAQHIVVLDLEVRNARRLGIGLLQAGDQLAGIVAQNARIVERRDPAFRDEPAIAHGHAGRLHQRGRKVFAQLVQRGMRADIEQPCEGGQPVGNFQIPCRTEQRRQRLGFLQPLAQGGEVARPAARQHQPGGRPFGVSGRLQVLAHLFGHRRVQEMRQQILPRPDHVEIR